MMKEKEYSGDLPPFVILTGAKGRFSEVGFLGDQYAPLVTGGNPNQPKFVVDGFVPPGGLTPQEIGRRFDLLSRIDNFGSPETFREFNEAGKKARHVIEGGTSRRRRTPRATATGARGSGSPSSRRAASWNTVCRTSP